MELTTTADAAPVASRGNRLRRWSIAACVCAGLLTVGSAVTGFVVSLGAFVVGCYGCSSSDGGYVELGLLVALSAGLVESVGALGLVAALVLLGLDAADIHRYDDSGSRQ